MDWLTTSTMLNRLRDFDDHAVWNSFAKRFHRPLLKFGRKLGLPSSEAEDAAQEVLLTFADAYRARKYDRLKGRLSHWLFGIAYRQIANARRKLAREGARLRSPACQTSFWRDVPDERDAQQAWDAEWEASLIAACMRQARTEVSESTYRAFEMIVREGRTPDEAAAELGMSRNAVYVAKHRLLKRLEELMKEYDELRPGAQ